MNSGMSVGPHDFVPLYPRWWQRVLHGGRERRRRRDQCRACFVLEDQHPVGAWVDARPVGVDPVQTTFVWCDCGWELVAGGRLMSDDAMGVYYECSKCGTRSLWDFDAPVPLPRDSTMVSGRDAL